MGFICNDKRINDNDIYNEYGIRRSEIDYAKKYLIERSDYIMKVTKAVGFMKPRVV